MDIPGKRYLGDGAFVEYDGFAFTLTTSDGIRDTNKVVLEPEMVQAFSVYVADVTKTLIKERERRENGVSSDGGSDGFGSL